jgi:hypothetical protein
MRADKCGARRTATETDRQQIHAGDSGERARLLGQEWIHGANYPLAYNRHGDTCRA